MITIGKTNTKFIDEVQLRAYVNEAVDDAIAEVRRNSTTPLWFDEEARRAVTKMMFSVMVVWREARE